MKIGAYEIKAGTAVDCEGLSIDERKRVAQIIVDAGANETPFCTIEKEDGEWKNLIFDTDGDFNRTHYKHYEEHPLSIINGKDLLEAMDNSPNSESTEDNIQWDKSIRGPMMSGTTGNRIWKYQMPVAEQFEMKLPKDAQIIRMAGENGYLWLWAVVDTQAPLETRQFESFKAGGTMPDDLSKHVFRGMAHIYIQQELMLYIFEVVQ